MHGSATQAVLTSRQRVRKAIRFEEPDRVPLDIGGSLVTGVCIDAYVDLVKHLGLDLGLPLVYEQFGMLARLAEPVRQRLHSDVIELENPSVAWDLENKDFKPWKTGPGNTVLMPGAFNPVTDEKGYLYIVDGEGRPLAYMPPGGLYFERACVTTLSVEDRKMDPQAWAASLPLYCDEHLRQLEESARQLYENTNYSIQGGFLKGGLGSNGIFAGHTITDWLCRLVTDPDYAFSILEATAQRAVENLRLYLQAVGKYIDTIFISGTDFGTQKGELFNPRIFKELYVPNIRRITDYVHQQSDAKTMYHSCGSNFRILEHFIEAGVDILNPVQTTAARMDPVELKRAFGGRIVFWGGGADTQTVLPHGTPEEVREQVKERMRIFGPGGGFVFSQVHNIQHGVPPQNILAMVDAAVEYGQYPL
jgi:uroporphyrinogen decarboxylase